MNFKRNVLGLLLSLSCCVASAVDSPWNVRADFTAVATAPARVSSPTWRLPPDSAYRQLELTCEFGSDAKGQLLLTGRDRDRKVVLWKVLMRNDLAAAPGKHRFAVLIAPEVVQMNLEARLDGAGALTLDNVSAALKPVDKLLPGVELLKSTWLGTRDNRLPVGWKPMFWPANETVFEVTPSRNGVICAHRSGGTQFGLEGETQLTRLPAGTVLRAAARFRCAGGGRAVLMAQFFDAAGKRIGEELSPAELSGSWGWMRCDFQVPERGVTARFFWLNTGTGTVTYLEAMLTVIAPEQAVKSFPMSVYSSPATGNRTIFNGETVFHTFNTMPLPLALDFKGEPGKLEQPRLVLEMPAALKLVGAYANHPAAFRAERPEFTKIERAGQAYGRYTFRHPAIFAMVEPIWRWNRQIVVAFETSDQVPADYPVYLYLADEREKGPEQTVTVRMLPELPQYRLPENFKILRWTAVDFNFPDSALLARSAQAFERVGLNSRTRSEGAGMIGRDAELSARNWRMQIAMDDFTHLRLVKKFAAGLPGLTSAVLADGSTDTAYLCPEYYCRNADFRVRLRGELAKRLAMARPGDVAMLDYEPWDTAARCFCAGCRELFRQFAGLKQLPTAADIRADRRAEWARFRCDQTARVNRVTAELIRELAPQVTVVDYDYPVRFGTPEEAKMFGDVCKDPRLYEDCVAGHLSSFYHIQRKAALELAETNVAVLKRPVWMTPSLSRNDVFQGSYTTADETITPARFRRKMLTAAVAGCVGICIFPGDRIDGAFFPAIGRAMSEIAVGEEFFRHGVKTTNDWQVTVPGTPESDWAFRAFRLAKDGRELLVFFNFRSDRALECRLARRAKGDADAQTRTVAPDDVVFWSVTPDGRMTESAKP